MENFEILSINRGRGEKKNDWVTEEVPLTIEVNGQELATLLCSPQDLKNLVLGFLFTSGFIEDVMTVKSLAVDEERWKAYVDVEVNFPPEMLFKRIYTSGCGKGILFHNPMDLIQRIKIPDGFTVEAEKISALMRKFLTSSGEYRQTGGVHSCALASAEEMLVKDDLGRHNALDKIIGAGLQQKLNFQERMVLTSGRISSEIISKVLRCGAPLLVSAGAPTNQAVKIAREANLTLLGFVRGQRMTVYSGAERIGCSETE